MEQTVHMPAHVTGCIHDNIQWARREGYPRSSSLLLGRGSDVSVSRGHFGVRAPLLADFCFIRDNLRPAPKCPQHTDKHISNKLRQAPNGSSLPSSSHGSTKPKNCSDKAFHFHFHFVARTPSTWISTQLLDPTMTHVGFWFPLHPHSPTNGECLRHRENAQVGAGTKAESFTISNYHPTNSPSDGHR